MPSSMEDSRSRRKRIEKRRKNQRFIKIFIFVGVLLLISIVGISTFGSSKESENTEQGTMNQVDEGDEETDYIHTGNFNDKQLTIKEEEIIENDNEHDLVIEKVHSTDDLVLEAYTANWKPVGTAQEEPHTVNFNEDSVDRIEMRHAILLATNLSEDNLIEWWIENGGEQKVIATVSDKSESDIYRVYLSWIHQRGWQPTKVEVLKENDKKTT